jgi:hypothetical protein
LSPTSASVVNQWYFSYQDPFAKDPTDWNVYAYFSSYAKMNGYNRYYSYYYNNPNIGTNVPVNDCNSLTVEDYSSGSIFPNGTYNGGPWPYAQKVNQVVPLYLNANSFQILCSGPDKVYGQGTRLLPNGTTTSYAWTPQNANLVSPRGQDDLSNFYDRPLGSGN